MKSTSCNRARLRHETRAYVGLKCGKPVPDRGVYLEALRQEYEQKPGIYKVLVEAKSGTLQLGVDRPSLSLWVISARMLNPCLRNCWTGSKARL